jgi:plasmid stability protein
MKQIRHCWLTRMLCCPLRSRTGFSRRLPGGIRRSPKRSAASRISSFRSAARCVDASNLLDRSLLQIRSVSLLANERITEASKTHRVIDAWRHPIRGSRTRGAPGIRRRCMSSTCSNVSHMSKMIQVRHVPDGVHRTLKARAAAAGMTLSDYLRVELEQIARQAEIDELLDAADAEATVSPAAFDRVWREVRRERDRR